MAALARNQPSNITARIISSYREQKPDGGYPAILVNSVNLTLHDAGPLLPDVFSHTSIKLVVPEPEEQTYIHDKYLGELLNKIFLPKTRQALLAITDELKARHGIEGLILGGTELPLILRDDEHNGVRLLDTTRIHVDRIVREL